MASWKAAMKISDFKDKGGRPRKEQKAKEIIMAVVGVLKRCNAKQIYDYYAKNYKDEDRLCRQTIFTYVKELADKDKMLHKTPIVEDGSKKLFLYSLHRIS